MKKGILFIIASAIIIGSALIPADKSFSSASGAAAGNSGAPGENNCTGSGCHNDNAPSYNDIAITLGTVPTGSLASGYTANTLYHLTVNMGSSSSVYGFQITSVDGSGAGVGTFAITNSSSTAVINGSNNKHYVNSITDGNAALTFNWTAPSSNSSPVYFYLAVVDGNGDHTATGDQVRLKAYKATNSSFGVYTTSAGISAVNADDAGIKIFPNPVKDQLNLTYAAPTNEIVKADIYNLNGQLVMPLFDETGAGHTSKSISLNSQMSSGIYIVRMAIGSDTYFKKILVQQ